MLELVYNLYYIYSELIENMLGSLIIAAINYGKYISEDEEDIYQ